MKVYQTFFIILMIVLYFTGCTRNSSMSQIYVSDSLAWGDNPHGNITMPLATAVSDEFLYVLDNTDSVFVYSTQTGCWINSFGGTGEGPGKFSVPQGIAILPDSNIIVADTFNRRLQVLSAEGLFIESISATFPNQLLIRGDEVFYKTYISADDHSGIYHFAPNGSHRLLFDMHQWMDENDCHCCWILGATDSSFIVSIPDASKMLRVTRDGQATELTLETPFTSPFRHYWGQALPFHEGFIAPYTLFERDLDETDTPITGDIRSALVHYTIDGSILHTYELPPERFSISSFSWTLDGDRAILADYLNGVVYCYDLD